MVTTADAERQCVTPAGLQDDINALVAKQPQGRAFVRSVNNENRHRQPGLIAPFATKSYIVH